MIDDKPLILWDGECMFCRNALNWLMHRKNSDRFQALAYQEAPAPPMTPELRAECERAVQLLFANGRRLQAGRAVLYLLEQTGWGFVARLLAQSPFIWIVEAVYRLVAAHRPFFARFLFTRP